MMTRINRTMVANILGAEWETLVAPPDQPEAAQKPEKEDSSRVDTDAESRNNNN